MIRNPGKLKKFHQQMILRENIAYPKALKIFAGLFQEARRLNVINSENILDGIEIDLKVAKAIHRLR